MSTTMVFVHGRGQEFKKPAELQRKWRASLASGLVKAGRPAADAAAVVFPFYGDLLYRITAELAQRGLQVNLEALPTEPDAAGPLHPYLGPDIGLLERKLVGNMADAAGAPRAAEAASGQDTTAVRAAVASREDQTASRLEVVASRADVMSGIEAVLSWGGARRALEWLSRHTRVDQEIITEHLRDVAVYLTRARDQVLDSVRQAIPRRVPIILVSHSLGTVVARDLLDDGNLRKRTVLWVTAGSPLGLEAIQKNLRTRGTRNPGVDWLTAYDVNDVVALGHPLRKTWGHPLRDVEVDNGDSPHSIERYLGHAAVAGPIGKALASS